MAQVPLQIRKDIRDIFDKDTSPVQRAFKKLADIVGFQVSCEIEWQMLWSELEQAYPDRATFVSSVSDVVEVWTDALAERLEDERFEDWTEQLLGGLESVREVKLIVQASDATRAQTWWLDTKHAFAISLPKKSSTYGPSATSGFTTDFENLFNREKHSTSTDKAPITAREDDDWADLESIPDTRSVSMSTRTRELSRIQQVPEALPSLLTLARPDILFPTLTPYLMHVSSSGPSKVTVSGTHEPSLRLLAEYLQRWVKQNPQDVRKVPLLRVKLNESSFGLGLCYDSVTIEPFDERQRHAGVNVVLILAFIQGVLAYEAVAGTHGAGFWEFKRNVPFKS